MRRFVLADRPSGSLVHPQTMVPVRSLQEYTQNYTVCDVHKVHVFICTTRLTCIYIVIQHAQMQTSKVCGFTATLAERSQQTKSMARLVLRLVARLVPRLTVGTWWRGIEAAADASAVV